MNEYDFAVKQKKELDFMKNEIANKEEKYILTYRKVEDIKNLNLDIDKLFRCCKIIDLTADYAENLSKYCKKEDIENKNLIAFVLKFN